MQSILAAEERFDEKLLEICVAGLTDKAPGTAKTVSTGFRYQLPPKFTMLYAVAVPDKGGATSVCNARAAYEALVG